MKREIIPQESNRAEAYRMWMSSPMPMVTFLRPVGSKRPEVERVKTLDVSRLEKVCKRSGMKFTMLMSWCIDKAASQTELDCIVNQYTDQFCNPMVMWGKYRKGMFKTTLPVSFQFHHVQMDGGHAARFLDILQDEIESCILGSSL